MAKSSYTVLTDKTLLGELAEENNLKHAAEDNLAHKKHGVWCAIKTKLHLKKHKGKSRKNKKDNNGDKDYLISESRESIPECNADQYAYKGRRVDFRVIPDKYDLLQEVNDETNSLTNDSGIHECSMHTVDLNEADKDKLMENNSKRRTLKEYLVKKWNGKRTKRARKGIRSTTGNIVTYLEVSLQRQYWIPDAGSLVAATVKNRN